jgi:PAS domain S-box-containing protein
VAGDAVQILQRSLLGEAVDGAVGVAVFVWNEERHYVAVNEEACRLVGLNRQALIGMPVGHLSPDRATKDIERVRDGDITEGTSAFTRPDGEVVEFTWTTLHTRVAGLPYMISFVRRREMLEDPGSTVSR